MNTQMLKDLFVLLFTDRLYFDIIIKDKGASVEVSNLPTTMSNIDYKLVGEVDDLQKIFDIFEEEECVAKIDKNHISLYVYEVSSLQIELLLDLIDFEIVELDDFEEEEKED